MKVGFAEKTLKATKYANFLLFSKKGLLACQSARIFALFFMVLDLRLVKIGCRETINFFVYTPPQTQREASPEGHGARASKREGLQKNPFAQTDYFVCANESIRKACKSIKRPYGFIMSYRGYPLCAKGQILSPWRIFSM